MSAKQAISAAFAARGLGTEMEAEVLSDAGDRRADVLVRHPSTGLRVAIEVQHSPLGLDAIERRTRAYTAAAVPVVWIATLDALRAPMRDISPGLKVVERYAAPDWQRFAAAYHGHLWFWTDDALWRGWLDMAWVAETWRADVGDGGWVPSRRWATLTLNGPFAPARTRIALATRQVEVHDDFALPGGRMARLVCDGERGIAACPTAPVWPDWDGRAKPTVRARQPR